MFFVEYLRNFIVFISADCLRRKAEILKIDWAKISAMPAVPEHLPDWNTDAFVSWLDVS